MKILQPSDIKNRPHYIEKVLPFVDKQILKVFTGQRRVGKSYLLYQLMAIIEEKNPKAKLIYINKEDLYFSNIKNATDLYEYVLANKSKTEPNYLFIDEIQDILEFHIALRSLLLLNDLDIYCTGSNANMLSSDIAGFLSGRYIEIIVYSLAYEEFLSFHNLENSFSTLEKYIKYGGLPYLKHLPLQDSVVFEYLKNVFNTIVYRDIINRYSIRNSQFLEQLVLFLANHTGSMFSAKKISDFLKSQQIKIAPNQIQIYIQYLTSAFLIQQVKRYDLVGKRIFEIGDKYYFENLGIRNALWGFRIEDRGKIIENVVYNHLLYQGYSVKIGIIGDLEIDFVAQKQGETKYIQVALSLKEENTIEREFGNLKKIKDNYPKLVITLDEYHGNSHEGIIAMDLRTFLSE
jgi:uncharacterized protein